MRHKSGNQGGWMKADLGLNGGLAVLAFDT
jgi:hypothetical protein